MKGCEEAEILHLVIILVFNQSFIYVRVTNNDIWLLWVSCSLQMNLFRLIYMNVMRRFCTYELVLDFGLF